jgi:hypothetical protein
MRFLGRDIFSAGQRDRPLGDKEGAVNYKLEDYQHGRLEGLDLNLKNLENVLRAGGHEYSSEFENVQNIRGTLAVILERGQIPPGIRSELINRLGQTSLAIEKWDWLRDWKPKLP